VKKVYITSNYCSILIVVREKESISYKKNNLEWRVLDCPVKMKILKSIERTWIECFE
tara:strand:- start:3205 stop:3375 length:171 start_codon:yes stop_codon:yes gene_type:complete